MEGMYVNMYICNYTYIINLFFMQPPEINKCSMFAFKHYDVLIYSEEGEVIVSKETDIKFSNFPNERLE